jgi:hypothetical protein
MIKLPFLTALIVIVSLLLAAAAQLGIAQSKHSSGRIDKFGYNLDKNQ